MDTPIPAAESIEDIDTARLVYYSANRFLHAPLPRPVLTTRPQELTPEEQQQVRENIGAAPVTGLVNFLINGDFGINQRGFAGGSLAAGVYGYDRWKAGTGGCNVSASGGTVTHASGPLVQIVEAPDLAGVEVTLSVEDLSGGSLNVNVEGQTGVITPGAGRRGVTLTVPIGSTGNVTVTLTPAGGAVTYRCVQLNVGADVLPFDRRHIGQEVNLCLRYFFRWVSTSINYGHTVNPAAVAQQRYWTVWFPVMMRSAPSAAPSLTFNSDSLGALNSTAAMCRFRTSGNVASGTLVFVTGSIDFDAEL